MFTLCHIHKSKDVQLPKFYTHHKFTYHQGPEPMVLYEICTTWLR
jgi:hypothetical protein